MESKKTVVEYEDAELALLGSGLTLAQQASVVRAACDRAAPGTWDELSHVACVSRYYGAIPAGFLAVLGPRAARALDEIKSGGDWARARAEGLSLNIDVPALARALLPAHVDYEAFDHFWKSSQAGICAVDAEQDFPGSEKGKTWLDHIAAHAGSVDFLRKKPRRVHKDNPGSSPRGAGQDKGKKGPFSSPHGAGQGKPKNNAVLSPLGAGRGKSQPRPWWPAVMGSGQRPTNHQHPQTRG